jgi:hypothetical protein
MISDPVKVREELRARVLLGYDPRWDVESAEDHGVDWLVLSREEFEAIRAGRTLDEKS